MSSCGHYRATDGSNMLAKGVEHGVSKARVSRCQWQVGKGPCRLHKRSIALHGG